MNTPWATIKDEKPDVSTFWLYNDESLPSWTDWSIMNIHRYSRYQPEVYVQPPKDSGESGCIIVGHSYCRKNASIFKRVIRREIGIGSPHPLRVTLKND